MSQIESEGRKRKRDEKWGEEGIDEVEHESGLAGWAQEIDGSDGRNRDRRYEGIERDR